LPLPLNKRLRKQGKIISKGKVTFDEAIAPLAKSVYHIGTKEVGFI